MAIRIVVLAAGKGKRMHSGYPKVLHTLAGKPLLEHVLITAKQLSPETSPIVVVGHQAAVIQHALSHYAATWIHQSEQLGTGHAVLQALPSLADDDHLLILCGDVPLVSESMLKKLIDSTAKDAIGMVTAKLPNPHGYGRIKRNVKQEIISIVEEKDASPEEKEIHEINPGIYFAPLRYLKKWLPQLGNHNAQKEYYLTDIISMAVKDGIPINSIMPHHYQEILGINDKLQLMQLERFYQQQCAEKLLRQGVMLYDANRLDIRGDVSIGRDVCIDVNVILEGRVIIGNHCTIGANVILRNVVLGDHVEIKPNTIIDGAEIAENAAIGPFARIRPGTVLAAHTHIGNFVELKNSVVNLGSKINHLSYIGDCSVGKHVNIGAGTITCNYDGVNKHKTIIEDDVFVGSNTLLVAPITIKEGATIAAGSTIIKDAEAHALTLTQQINQRVKKDWKNARMTKKTGHH